MELISATIIVLAIFGLTTSQYGQVGIAVLVAALAFIERRWHRETKARQEEIHVLVNSRLTEALDEIVALKNRLDAKDAVITQQEATAAKARETLAAAAIEPPK